MSKWLIVILFLVSMFLDGIIFPALFDFRESFLTIIFLVVMLLYYEVGIQGLVLGVVLSGSAEFYGGLKLGVLMLPLLAAAAAFFLLNRFFNIKNRVLIIILGVVMFIIFWESSILINKII